MIFGFDLPYVAIITLLSAVIHESGHLIASYKISKSFTLTSRLYGFRLKTHKKLSYKDEIFISAAGPLANIAVFILLLPFYKKSLYIFEIGIINLLTAFSNLLPIESHDGYRIIECTAMQLSFGTSAIRVLRIISFFLLSLFLFISLYLMKKINGGYWIFFIFMGILLKSIKNDKSVFFTRKNEKK